MNIFYIFIVNLLKKKMLYIYKCFVIKYYDKEYMVSVIG